MDPAAFRAAAHVVVDLIAEYLATVEGHPVFPAIEPGALRPLFPADPPEMPESIDAILADYDRLIVPNATHWQHPGFMAYFATTASGPGILGEMLTAALGQNPMLWRTSPVGTELEEVVVDWLRQGLGLPDGFDGLLTDTASTSSLIALAAAREVAGLDVAAKGLAGRPDVPPLRVYASQEAHSSIEKACMTLGVGRENLVRIPVDDAYAMRPDVLDAAIAADRACRSSTDRDRGDDRHDVVDGHRPSRRDRRHRKSRRALAPCRLGLRRPRSRSSRATRRVRRLGTSRFDRREPPQVAVHAA
jgi:aromatic-L-amino-acid decarboxylase